MKQVLGIAILVVSLSTSSCLTKKAIVKDDGKLEVVIVQVNDVYEIAPVNGGKEGGMARIATLKKQYQKANPNTFLVMAGDFISPSIYNSLQFEGKSVRGAQMVEVMNSAGMDIVCFGNHEFDFPLGDLQARLNESNFTWISSNAFHKLNTQAKPFEKTGKNAGSIPTTLIKTVRDKNGTIAKIGFMGLVLPANRADYVSYTNALSTAKQMYSQLKDSVDAVVAITHLDSAEDKTLARELPGLAAILGGHEHNGFSSKIGNVHISKAQSNARSAYVIKLNIDKKKNNVNVQSELVHVNNDIALDSTTNEGVKKWRSIVQKSYANLGFDINGVIINSGEPLDLTESIVYSRSTNFTRIVTAAMADACPLADVVMFNAGSIRSDDNFLIPAITQYDIIRSMPYGGGIREVDMKGSMLIQILDSASKNIHKGGWLHYEPVVYSTTAQGYLINNIDVDHNKIYRVALTDFMLTGKETRLHFLNENNPSIVKVYPAETSVGSSKSDIRLAIVKYLLKKK